MVDKEKIELAKEHIKLAQQLIDEETANAREKDEKEFIEAKFALEKADSEITDLEELKD